MVDKIISIVKGLLNNIEKKYLIIGGALILLLLVMGITSSCGRRKVVVGDLPTTYENLKITMIEKAKEYYDDNPIFLPKEGEKKEISIGILVNNMYLQELSNYVPKGVDCSGKVVVRRIDKEYNYVAFLDCGEYFSEASLLDAIEDTNVIVTTGDGLYKIGDNQIFRGEPENNYIQIENTIWRIVKIDKDNSITIIYESSIVENKLKIDGVFDESYVWDDRFNTERMEIYGINNFEVSRIKETIFSLEKNTSIIPEGIKEKLIKKNLCVEKRELSDASSNKDNSIECAKLSVDKFYIGTITPSDFMMVSLDNDCKNVITPACSNYNYLTNYNRQFWLLNSTTNNTYDVIFFAGLSLSQARAISEKRFRPTLFLSDSVIKVSGIGTITEPYLIK